STTSFTLNIATPTIAPTIASPANNSTVGTTTVSIRGTAPVGTQVQLYVDGSLVGGLLNVDNGGNFFGVVTLTAEATYAITADARNIRGTTPLSLPVSVTYAIPEPSVVVATPSNGATLSGDSNIELVPTVQGGRTITSVALSIDGVAAQTFTAPPYRYAWNVANVANGSHTISVVATDSAGRTGSGSATINLQKPPPPVITPYIGRIDSVTPNQTFGSAPIAIAGRALGRADNVAVGGAPLLLKFSNAGFVRTINVVTNVDGTFTFNFVPQENDSGSYNVSLIHPDENTVPAAQGNFSVNRLTVNNNRIRLRASRGFTERFTVNLSASVGSTASNVMLVTPASAQPSGTLPLGVSATAAPITVSSNAGQVPYEISFTSTAQSPNTGVLVAQLLANESGSEARAEIRIDFELVNAEPVIVPTPSVLSLGTRRGQVITERVTLENKGLVAADGVTATLLTVDNAAPPAWASLATGSSIGTLAAGAKIDMQISATPDTGVDDGIYQFKLRVQRNVGNTPTLVGDLPISIAVTSSENGRAFFETANIYTNTRDANNNLIQGVENVRISLQNEAVPTQTFAFTTTADGTVQTNEIPAGRYRWRASVANHKDASGIVVVRPGGNTQQKIFLEYTVVSFNFSVTETTIQDQYDVVITATFQTQVPAPVVIIEPSAINVPPMQVGEQISGEITITNYGLVRADNVVFTPPQSNQNWNIEIGGTVPSSLDAKSRIVLPYKLTLVSALPSGAAPIALKSASDSVSLIQRAMANGMIASTSPGRADSNLRRLTQKSTTSSCSSVQASGQIVYEFDCANGDRSSGSGGFAFTSTRGSACGGGVSNPSNPTCTTSTCGNGGGWGGAGGGGIPIGGPTCTPDCPSGTCCNGAGSGGGGK
ncbi:MAG: Ig-like domain-containing protein, partial [Casimicrobium sp.]